MLYALFVALAAFLLGFLNLGGAVVAAIVGGLVWEAGGLAMAIPLLAFFLSSSLLGKLTGGGQKEGSRTAGQVIANGGAAAISASLMWLDVSQAPTMFLAALCAANADTWATEIGMRFGKAPRRATTLKPAQPGVSGAVTVAGLAASAAGACFVALAGSWMVGTNLALAAALGFAGALLDSVLGDTVQAKFWTSAGVTETGGTLVKGVRWIRNNEVNFAMTSAAALGVYLLAG
jgi:uncharacterized protein (TIGR00297 family)